MHIGYDGPIVAEPFNRPLQSLSPDGAVGAVSEALDACVWAASRRMLPAELVGTHPYFAEVLSADNRTDNTTPGVDEAFSRGAHADWHRINSKASDMQPPRAAKTF
jgi:hypothetical protein